MMERIEQLHTIRQHNEIERVTHELYLCSIFPVVPSIELLTSLEMLKSVYRLDVIPVFIQAGHFKHRNRREEADTEQCRIRQQYVDQVPEGRWMLILDNDELLFGALQRLPELLDILEEVEAEVASIAEIRPDLEIRMRPRLIKKREGLQYGGETQKHDWIDFNGENYISPTKSNMFHIDCLAFLHYKQMSKLSVSSNVDGKIGGMIE